MTLRIRNLLIAFLPLTVSLAVSPPSFAGELDNEAQVTNVQALRAQELPQTVVVRIDTQTGEAAVLESTAPITASEANAQKVQSATFKTISTAGVAELDTNSSKSSWFCWFNTGYYYQPTYHYYGYQYQYRNYYSYNWGRYVYNWYRWRW